MLITHYLLNKREYSTFVMMKQKKYIQKLALATLFVFAFQVVFAAFTLTGNTTNKKSTNKYSLKNLSKYTSKGLSLSAVRLNSRLSATELNSSTKTGINLQTTNGNTTFIYPYQIKVKVPKFKTPSSN